jgi:hypothetical protein
MLAIGYDKKFHQDFSIFVDFYFVLILVQDDIGSLLPDSSAIIVS